MKLPLSRMFASMKQCLELCVEQGPKQILYRQGQKFYQQLLSDEQRGNSDGGFVGSRVEITTSMLSNLMDLLTGVGVGAAREA